MSQLLRIATGVPVGHSISCNTFRGMALLLACFLITCVFAAPYVFGHSGKPIQVDLDIERLRSEVEESVRRTGTATLSLPGVGGFYRHFVVSPSKTMDISLAEKYPHINSYSLMRGRQQVGTITISHNGITALIQSDGEVIELSSSPANPNRVSVTPATAEPVQSDKCAVTCSINSTSGSGARDQTVLQHYVSPVIEKSEFESKTHVFWGDEGQVWEFRIALAFTAELSNEIGSSQPDDGMAFASEIINQLNFIYSEIGARFVLVHFNDELIFTDPQTDPFSDSESSFDWLCENAIHIEANYSSSDYDLGHVLGTVAVQSSQGGYARYCYTGPQYCSQTGMYHNNRLMAFSAQYLMAGHDITPYGYTYYTLPHEFGHQLGFIHLHTSSVTGYSLLKSRHLGTTIMTQSSRSTPWMGLHFHALTVNDFVHLPKQQRCSLLYTNQVFTGNYRPEISVPALSKEQSTIPLGTPFILSGSATDKDGDTLAYCWTPMNNTSYLPSGHPNDGVQPVFPDTQYFAYRPPTYENGDRSFPSKNTVYAGYDYMEPGHQLPSGIQSEQVFRLIVTDGIPGGGGLTVTGDVALNVLDYGPFTLTSPHYRTVFSKEGPTAPFTRFNVSWDTNGLDDPQSGLGLTYVDVLLSTNGGETFDYILQEDWDVSMPFSLIPGPNVSTNRGRVKVKSKDHLFYAVNPGVFQVNPTSAELQHVISQHVAISNGRPMFSVNLSDPQSEFQDCEATLYWRLRRTNSEWHQVGMTENTSGPSFSAEIPFDLACTAVVEYYFLLENDNDAQIAEPSAAPWVPFVFDYLEPDVVHEFTSTTTDWQTGDDGLATNGHWDLVDVSTLSGHDFSPRDDWNGSGFCWVTGKEEGEDVDGGSVYLYLPPVLDSKNEPLVITEIEFAYWLSDSPDSPFDVAQYGFGDALFIEVKNPLDGTWVSPTLDTGFTSTSMPGWRTHRMRIGTPGSFATAFTEIRFVARDVWADSHVEAAIDHVKIYTGSKYSSSCDTEDCPIDYALPRNVIDLRDLEEFLRLFVANDPAADLAAPFEQFDMHDITAFMSYYNSGCAGF